MNWFEENRDNILAVADDPLNNLWWRDADEKWQFLRWCFEVQEYLKTGKSFESHMPRYIDGSANGVQHISALLRRKDLAESVNLGFGPPVDIYESVRKSLMEKLAELLQCGNDDALLATMWLGKNISRSDIKNVLMPFSYGKKPETCIKEFRKKYHTSTEDAKWLYDKLEKLLHDVHELRENLQSIAAEYNQFKQHLEWTAPSGFICRQRYYEMEYKAKTYKDKTWNDTKHKAHELGIRVKKIPLTLRKEKSRTAFAANFIHSLDAAVLTVTVCHCMEQSIKDIAVLHDCWGAPIGDFSSLGLCARQAFAAVHKYDLLLYYYRWFEEQLSTKIPVKILFPAPPKQGDFDVSQVPMAIYSIS
jgi:DNA-directed RNA polymerase